MMSVRWAFTMMMRMMMMTSVTMMMMMMMMMCARWAFTMATWMKERDRFAGQIQRNDLYEEGLYYTGSKSHPW